MRLLLILLLTVPVCAQTILVDGRPLTGRAVSLSGRTFVPLRPIFEALGARVNYAGGVIDGQKGDRLVQLKLGSPLARVNGVLVQLDAPARLIGTATYVPLRFVAEALGARVRYSAGAIAVDSTLGPVAAPTPGPPPPPQAFQPSRDLKRIRVGNQAGILKVVAPDGKSDAAFRGIDDRNIARYTPEGRAAVLAALGISSADAAARQVMDGYSALPKKECLALLGALAAGPLEPGVAQSARRFLAARVALEKDVALRRQAVLALAVASVTDRESTDEVVRFFETSENLWETFTVQMFFEYQAGGIRRLPEFARVRSRVAAVKSLYTPYILGYLDSQDNAPQVGF